MQTAYQLLLILAIISFQGTVFALSYNDADAIRRQYYEDSKLSLIKKIYYRLTARSQDVDDNDKLINQYLLAEESYDNNYSQESKIPKILHHIWLGDKPLPPLYARYINQCRQINPGWKHKLWTNADIKSFDGTIQKLVRESKSYHEQADILRLAILKQIGGVYLDADIKCLSGFDDLLHRYNFIVSIDYAKRRVLNGIIASNTNHPIINSALDDLSKNFQDRFAKFFVNSYDPDDPLKTFHRLAIERTMLPLNHALLNWEKLNKDKELMVLPLEYCMKPYVLSFSEKIKSFFGYYLDKSNEIEFFKFAKCFHSPSPSNSYIGFPRFSFALSNSLGNFKAILKGVTNGDKALDFYKYLYEKHYPAVMPISLEPKIPQLLHFSNISHTNIQKWLNNFAGYKFKLWSKEEKDLLLAKYGYNELSGDEVRAMVASLLILKIEGGVIINDDLIGSRDIDDLLYQYNLILALDPIVEYKDKLQLSRKFMAAANNQVYLRKALEFIYVNQSSVHATDDVIAYLNQAITENYPLDQKLIVMPGYFFFSQASFSTYTHYEK